MEKKILGLIGATQEEFAQMQQLFDTEAETVEIAGLIFVRGTCAGTEIVGVRAGIGKVNAALCTQALIDRFAPDAVINLGVAGALDERLHVGDIVVAEDAVQHDFDTTYFGDEPGQIPGMENRFFRADGALVQAAETAAETLGYHCLKGRVLSGDQFIADGYKKEELKTEFGGLCTEMEGAAIAQVCALNRKPFAIIRSISDGADDGAPMQYEEFVNFAAERGTAMIRQMLQGC